MDLDKLEKMRVFRLAWAENHLLVVEEAIRKSVGYAVTSGKRELSETKSSIKFWSNQQKVLEWATKIDWKPREGFEYGRRH